MKTGLVLEGGAMRGLFTSGILDVMMENGIRFDGLIGVSAGAAFGCNFKSGQPGRVLRYNLKYCRDPRYCGVRTFLRTGELFGAQFCYHELPDRLDPFDRETFVRSPMEFYAVCTDTETGEAVYRKLERADATDMEWIRASASLPLVSHPVPLDGRYYLDGGIADSIPLRYFERIGYDRCVVILTQPRGYVKRPSRILPLMRLAMRRWPRTVDALSKRHEIYNASTQYVLEEEKAGRALVLCPDEKLPIGRIEHNPDVLRAVYASGRAVGERQLDSVRRFLAE